ncbi:hypothetical protein M408DRAFT_225181 [Serendipita vermifera MAFF 305830]|uniref:Uncharacterized protein n=1 Tax=Serendipita vermifera MAFF 305830 TaxID=933852 RepID=A0A0C3B075_SERVB|nr:hypothetical protein M408DRAFT_225181 [Serendipita vermifera MAFF 305830]
MPQSIRSTGYLFFDSIFIIISWPDLGRYPLRRRKNGKRQSINDLGMELKVKFRRNSAENMTIKYYIYVTIRRRNQGGDMVGFQVCSSFVKPTSDSDVEAWMMGY